jgi:tetratricopeptide (TPR) repeat protein
MAGRQRYRPALQRFAYIFTGAILLAAPVAITLHGHLAERQIQQARQLLADAQRAEEEGNLEQALRDVKRALKLQPPDVQSLAWLGRLYEQVDDDDDAPVRAMLHYEQALRADPRQHDLRRRLIDLAFGQRRFTDALYHLDQLRPHAPQDAQLWSLTAQARQRLGEHHAAALAYLQAARANPRAIEPWRGLADLTLDSPRQLPLQDIARLAGFPWEFDGDEEFELPPPRPLAEKLLEQMVEQAQPQHAAYFARAAYYREAGQLDRAEQDLQRAMRLGGDDVSVLALAAELLLLRTATRDPDAHLDRHRATELIQHGLKLKRDDSRLLLLAAQVEAGGNRLAEAESLLREGLHAESSRLPTDPSSLQSGYLWSLAQVLLAQQGVDPSRDNDLRDEVAQLVRQLKQAGAWRFSEMLQGQALYQQRRWRDAQERLERARPVLAPFPQLTHWVDRALGRCAGKLVHPEERLRIYRRGVDEDPAWEQGRRLLAFALAAVNRCDEAVQQWHAIKDDSGQHTAIGWLRLHADMLRSDRAAILHRPDVGVPSLNNVTETPAILLHAELLARQGQVARAYQILEGEWDNRPDDPFLWGALVELSLNLPGWEESERTSETQAMLAAATERFGTRAELEMAALRLAARQSREAAVQTLRTLEGSLPKLDGRSFWRLCRAVAYRFRSLGQVDDARRVLQQAAERDPDALAPRLLLAHWAIIDSEPPAAIEKHLEELRDIEGPHGPNTAALSYLPIVLQREADPSPRQFGEARRRLLTSRSQRPHWQVPSIILEHLERQAVAQDGSGWDEALDPARSSDPPIAAALGPDRRLLAPELFEVPLLGETSDPAPLPPQGPFLSAISDWRLFLEPLPEEEAAPPGPETDPAPTEFAFLAVAQRMSSQSRTAAILDDLSPPKEQDPSGISAARSRIWADQDFQKEGEFDKTGLIVFLSGLAAAVLYFVLIEKWALRISQMLLLVPLAVAVLWPACYLLLSTFWEAAIQKQ